LELSIDIGNTFIKIGVFELSHLKKVFKFNSDRIQSPLFADFLSSILIEFPGPHRVIISSVVDLKEETKSIIQCLGELNWLSPTLKLNFQNAYETPETLGLDRIAALAGAALIDDSNHQLIIMAGTCITYDLLDQQGIYQGGVISPGKLMRTKAMNTFTAKLPLIHLNNEMNIKFLGTNTEDCLKSGVIWGIYHEVEGFINQFQKVFHPLNIILVGGDANFLDTHLKNTIFAHQIKWMPDLVLIGLNRILTIQDA